MVRWLGTLLGVGCCPQPINQVHVFYAAMSEMGSVLGPLKLLMLTRLRGTFSVNPRAVSAMLSEQVTDKEEAGGYLRSGLRRFE